MRALIILAAILLSACESTKVDGFSHTSFLKDVAYEKSKDGSVRFVSKTSPAASDLISEAGQTARGYIQGKLMLKAVESAERVTTNRDTLSGQAVLKGTKDPNIIPKDPNIIPEDPNIIPEDPNLQ